MHSQKACFPDWPLAVICELTSWKILIQMICTLSTLTTLYYFVQIVCANNVIYGEHLLSFWEFWSLQSVMQALLPPWLNPTATKWGSLVENIFQHCWRNYVCPMQLPWKKILGHLIGFLQLLLRQFHLFPLLTWLCDHLIMYIEDKSISSYLRLDE